MITATARKHIVSALRQALRLPQAEATAILDTVRNHNMLDMVDGPMHGVIAVVGETPVPSADLYRDESRGYRFVGSLLLTMEDLNRWKRLDMADAYAIAALVAAKPYADRRDEAANDDHAFGLDGQAGSTTTPRKLDWVDDAQVCGCENKGSHIEMDVMIGSRLGTAIMLPSPLNPDMDGLTRYVMEQLGREGSLLMGLLGDNDLGLDPDTSVVDMIMPDEAKRVVAATHRNRYAA